jgi:hypothetical protein
MHLRSGCVRPWLIGRCRFGGKSELAETNRGASKEECRRKETMLRCHDFDAFQVAIYTAITSIQSVRNAEVFSALHQRLLRS